MIKFTQGDIFESKSQTIVATVNCVGIMGKGLAKEFRLRFPDMYQDYVRACKKGELQSGRLLYYKDLQHSIICFPTKDNWKGPSKYEFIEAGLKTFVEKYKEWGITSIAFPPLGCGLGGLDWKKVRELIVKYLGPLPIDVEIYEPLPSAERIPVKNPFRTNGTAKLTPAVIYTGEMIRIAREAFPVSMAIGRLLLQKIAFFSQMAGLPIKLQFTQYKLGPYDGKLRFNVDRLEGLYVRDASPTLQRSDLKMLDEQAWLEHIEKLDVDLKQAREKIHRAVNFLKKYTLKDIELFATVLSTWCSIVLRGDIGEVDEIVAYIEHWKAEKFTPEQIKNALDILIKDGWIDPAADESLSTAGLQSEAIHF